MISSNHGKISLIASTVSIAILFLNLINIIDLSWSFAFVPAFVVLYSEIRLIQYYYEVVKPLTTRLVNACSIIHIYGGIEKETVLDFIDSFNVLVDLVDKNEKLFEALKGEETQDEE